MHKKIILRIFLGVFWSIAIASATMTSASDILRLSVRGVAPDQMIEWPDISSIPENLLSDSPLKWSADYSDAYANVAADWVDSLRLREPGDASVSFSIELKDTLINIASAAGLEASGGELRASVILRQLSALGNGDGAPVSASESAGYLPSSNADVIASKSMLSGGEAALSYDGSTYGIRIAAENETTAVTLAIDFACAAFVTLRQVLDISVILEHRANVDSEWRSLIMTAPSAYQLFKRCSAQQCGDLCEAHGTCRSNIGFCECDDTWYGLECEFQFVFPSEACPGDELPMEFFLPATHFANLDWMAFVRGDAQYKHQQEDWLYLASLSQQGFNDGYLKEVAGSYTFHTFLRPGVHYFMLFLEDSTTVVVAFPFTILDYSDERCAGRGFRSALRTATKCLTDATFVNPLCAALNCTAEDVCDDDMQCAFDECGCRGSRFGAACERGCDAKVTYDAQQVIVSTDIAMASADDPTTFEAYYPNSGACVFDVVPADGADAFEVAVIVSEFVDDDFVSLVSVTESGDIVEELRIFSPDDVGTGTFTVRANALRFELWSSSTGQARGLYAKVTALHDPPLTPAGITLLVVGLLLLVAAVVAAIVFFVRRFLHQKSQAAERAALLPALTLANVTGAADALANLKRAAQQTSSRRKKKATAEAAAAAAAAVTLAKVAVGANASGGASNVAAQQAASPFENHVPVATETLLKAKVCELNLAALESTLQLEVNPSKKRNLLFGLGTAEALPVNQWCTDTIVLRNTRVDGQPITFAFLVDECVNQYELIVQPGCGVVTAGAEVRVVVKLRLFYTCHLDRFLTVAACVGAYPFFDNEQVELSMDEWLGRDGKRAADLLDVEQGADLVRHASATALHARRGSSVDLHEEDGAKAAQLERMSRHNVMCALNTAASDWVRAVNPAFGAFRLRFDGALSDRLDPDELELFGDPLASGAYGVVYKGAYRGATCAVKILKQQKELGESQLAEFEREIDIFRRLRSPYILGFVGASHVPTKMCLCTELMEHGSLARLIFEFTPAYILKIKYLLDAANALQYLHANRVIYRDVKTDNFLVLSTNYTAKVACKLADFGTAKSVTSTSEQVAHTGGLGTVVYMAPEVLESAAYDAKVDIYSFAMMMYEMYTQQVPWRGVKLWDIPNRVLAGDRPELPKGIPSSYRALLWKCWASHGDKRPAAEEVVNDMDVIFKVAKKERSKLKERGELSGSGKGRGSNVLERRLSLSDLERHRANSMSDGSTENIEGFKHQPSLTESETSGRSKLASEVATSVSPRKRTKKKTAKKGD